MEILRMNKKEVLSLLPEEVNWILTAEEIVHMAKSVDAFWSYDYQAARDGIPGKHALLKSMRHSDGFFISRIFLQYPNIKTIMANQLVLHFNQLLVPVPDWIVGIPNGATGLGKEVAYILDVGIAQMEKVDGQIILASNIGDEESLLLVEDFCTRGTGFSEAVRNVLTQNPNVNLLPYELVIINRGGLTEIVVPNVGSFKIVAAANYRINDWDEEKCPLCNDFNSIPIKPKATDANWKDITTSQLR